MGPPPLPTIAFGRQIIARGRQPTIRLSPGAGEPVIRYWLLAAGPEQ